MITMLMLTMIQTRNWKDREEKTTDGEFYRAFSSDSVDVHNYSIFALDGCRRVLLTVDLNRDIEREDIITTTTTKKKQKLIQRI